MDLLDRCADNGLLHLIVLPTEACNFRCTYCFEDFKLQRMQPWVVLGLERWIGARAPGLRRLELSWFGGEPLLARKTIERLLLHVRALQRQHSAMQFDSSMTTNAYLLTPEVLDRLVGLGVTTFQVSFDGPRDWHDRKRILAGGRGTFDRIWQNVLAMRDSKRDFAIRLRLHVDAENLEALPEFIQEYNRLLAADPRYRLYVQPLGRFGGPNDDRLPVLDRPVGRTLARELERMCEDHEEVADSESDLCYAVRGNSWVVRADGRLNKCSKLLNHPANQVGTLEKDGRVKVRSDRLRVWMRGLLNANSAELTCPAHGLSGTAR